MRDIQLVNQINDQSCVHACIAMVTGKTVEEYWERYPKPLGPIEELVLLIESKIFPNPMNLNTLHNMPFFGCYLVSAPSLNCPGVNHRLLVQVTNDDEYIVYDPQTNREGKKWYSRNGFDPFAEQMVKGYNDVNLLRFDVLTDLRI